MDGFPLLDLIPSHLEKIINKLEEKEYFRLRQTCHGVNDFIHNSRNISVHQYYYHQLRPKSLVNGLLFSSKLKREIQAESLFGTRVRFLIGIPEIQGNYTQLYEFFKNYRITCEKLIMSGIDKQNPEQHAALIHLLKPVYIRISGCGLNDIEALLASKTLKEIEISCESEDALQLAAEFIPKLSTVSIRVFYKEDMLDLIASIAKLFLSQPLPNLKSFFLDAKGLRRMPSRKEIEDIFYGMSIRMEKCNAKRTIFAIVLSNISQLGQSGEIVVDFTRPNHPNTLISYQKFPIKLADDDEVSYWSFE